jgi:hypothetical protein
MLDCVLQSRFSRASLGGDPLSFSQVKREHGLA